VSGFAESPDRVGSLFGTDVGRTAGRKSGVGYMLDMRQRMFIFVLLS
jgi:hypothetical protein